MRTVELIEIERNPADIWPWLENPARWPLWLAQDGPQPRTADIKQMSESDTKFLAEAVDGQTAVFEIFRRAPEETIAWALIRSDNAALEIGQNHTINLHWAAENLTVVEWVMEWERPGSGWRKALTDWLLHGEIEEMLNISLENLAALAEGETDDDNDSDD